MSLSPANHVGVYDAKTHFSDLLKRVESGEEITITKHGTPVARLVPVMKKFTVEERRAAIERIKNKKLGEGLSLGGRRIRDLMNAGRR